MKSVSVYSHKDAGQIGSVARTCLMPGQHGKVFANFSRAIYLLTSTDDLFWIATEKALMHRRCVTIPAPLPELKVGSPFHVEGQRLTIASAFVVDMTNISVWDAPSVHTPDIGKPRELGHRIQSFFSTLNLSEAKGFGSFIPQILSLLQNESVQPVSEIVDPILRFAQPLVLDIARACLNRNTRKMAQHADKLVGLGSGLTPSGDDFLGGMLFARKLLEKAYPDLYSFNDIIQIESYRARTHIISFTLLKDLASGHAIAPLHQILNGLFQGEAIENIFPFVSQLTAVGHSTGWDLLTGLLTGLLPTYRK